MNSPWLFYVYALTDECGVIRYIGKGSGGRLRVQIRKNNMFGYEIARFKKESDAYAFEVVCIATHSPTMNMCAGGNGPRSRCRQHFVSKEFSLIRKIGTRAYAARTLLAYARHLVDPSILNSLELVSYGPPV